MEKKVAIGAGSIGITMRVSGINTELIAPPTEPSIVEGWKQDIDFMAHIEDIKYSHLTSKQRNANIIDIRRTEKISRNTPCPCGSGKKYKRCCINK